MGKHICPHCLTGRITLGRCVVCKKEVIVMGKISDLVLEYPTQESRDKLRKEVEDATSEGRTTIHDGSQFIPLEKAVSILNVLENQPVIE
jgi:hypothetical protein